MRSIVRFIQRKRYGLPKSIKNVWWNASRHIEGCKFPMVHFERRGFIRPKKGIAVAMREVKPGLYAYYTVVNYWRKSGDWLYREDAYHANLEFYKLEKETGVFEP